MPWHSVDMLLIDNESLKQQKKIIKYLLLYLWADVLCECRNWNELSMYKSYTPFSPHYFTLASPFPLSVHC